MKLIRQLLIERKAMLFILLWGILLRLLFVFVLGRIYYGRSDYYIQGDTGLWFNSFINLWEHGTFTTGIHSEAGKFFRPPGYSFLFGFFYLLSFKHMLLATRMLVACQLIMDIASIYLVGKIAERIIRTKSEHATIAFSNLAALLYSSYPFAIVWAPVLYAETSSVFFLLLGIYFAVGKFSYKNSFLAGLFGGIATLLRLQCAFCLPVIAISYFFAKPKLFRENLRAFTFFSLAVMLSYGLWPARNFFFQHRLLLSQDQNIGFHWSRDFISFLDFIYAVRTDHIPVYKQIIENKKVEWPKEAYLDPGDSLLLDSVVNLCRTCGTGFSYWKVYRGIPGKFVKPEQSCDTLIDRIFTSLYIKQKTKNPINYWIKVPFRNLSKCFFKVTLYETRNKMVKIISTTLFLLRTALIFLGLAGLFVAFRKRSLRKRLLIIVSGFMVVWYFYLSFFLRNIEMRFLLQCDVLLLIPAAYLLLQWFLKSNEDSTDATNFR
jgi:Gpi18-like mannosyltransferase